MTDFTTILLDASARHVTICRGQALPADIDQAREALQRAGMSGFIAELHGRYHRRGSVRLVMLHRIGEPGATWAQIETEFHQLRADNT